MEKKFTIEVETTLSSGTLSPDAHWGDRDAQSDVDKASMAIWDSMTATEQEAAKRVVRDCLAALYQQVDDMLMLSFRPDKPGQFYDIHFRILAGSLEEYESVHEQATGLKIKAAADKVRSSLQDVLGMSAS